jgi:uncharacterized membrane protein YcaP (DUF421 family)
MIHDVWLNIASALGLGLEPRDFTFTQIAPRAVVVFVSALVMVRLGAKRFFGKKTAFDLLVGVVLASTLSRAVNGSAAFFPTIGAGFVVIELHRLLALLAFHSHSFGLLIKGEADILIENGRTIQKNVSANYLTDDDLLEEVRLEAAIEDFGKIEKAYIERSGEVSVIVRKS